MKNCTCMECEAKELRSEHCKIYAEPSLKKAVQDYADENRVTFSEAGRRLWVYALNLKNQKKETK